MMSGSIYGLNNYYSAFVSPLKSYQVTPITNLMYGALASTVYANTVAKSARSTVSSYLSSMNTIAGSLKAAAKPLSTQGTESSFSRKAVASSDNGSVTGTAKWNADIKTYSLTVSRLATGQKNKGAELASNNPSAFGKGLNTFTVKSGNSEKTVAFTVNDKDTNRSALDKMAVAINKSGADITASVATGSKPSTAYIKLSSSKTGTDSAFSLTDTTGNAVSASGADTIQEKAQNAFYTLDGKQYESQSNTVDINNGKVSLTMNKADGREIKLSVGFDTMGIQNGIKYSNQGLAGNDPVSYNNLMYAALPKNAPGLYNGMVLDIFL